VMASTAALLKDLRQTLFLWHAGLALSWFWLTGAVALSLVPVVVRDATGGGIEVEAAVSALFAIGIGSGSLAAAFFARGRIIVAKTPIAALGMAFFLIDIGFATHGLAASHGETGVSAFFTSITGLHIAADVGGMAASGGFYTVPIFAALLAEAPMAQRARIVAAVNILNAIFMVGGTLATALLQSRLIGLSEPVLLIGLGLANIGAAAYVRWQVVSKAPKNT